MESMLFNRMIFAHISGSVAYGTNIPGHSDVDIKAIYRPPLLYFISQTFRVSYFGQVDKFCRDFPEHLAARLGYNTDSRVEASAKTIWDFLRVALNQSPGDLEALWVENPEHILYTTPAFEALRARRQELLTLSVADAYIGYAKAQLDRMGNHKAQMDSAMEEPKFSDFLKVHGNIYYSEERFPPEKCVAVRNTGLGENNYFLFSPKDISASPCFTGESFHHITAPDAEAKGRHRNIDLPFFLYTPLYYAYLDKEAYYKARRKWNGYQTWIKNRNPARHELEKGFGYDTKHAMHVLRLLRMAYEILTEKVVRVWRPDAKELLDVRDGKYNLEGFQSLVETLVDKVQEAKEVSDLPKELDPELIDTLLITFYGEVLTD